MAENSRESLILENMGLVFKVINSEFPKYRKDEDIEQIGMVGLCLAAENYKEDNTAKFSTYAYSCIRNEILRELKKEANRVKTVSLDTLIYDSAEDKPLTLEDTTAEDATDLFIDWDYYGASEVDRRIIEGLALGKTNKEIGKEVGLSEASIKKHRAKIDRQRFEDSINYL